MITFLCAAATRLFPVAVLGCVLYFPFFKGVMAGYAPVGVGITATLLLLAFRTRIEHGLETRSRSWMRFFLYGLPALVQITLVLAIQPIPLFDGLNVMQHAERFASTGNMDPLTYYPPAQAWWYAFWFYMVGATTLVAQVSHIPLSLAVTWQTRLLSRDVLPEPASRLAALAVAWYPTFIGYVLTTPYYHYLYTLLTLVMVRAAIRHGRHLFRRVDMPWMFVSGLAAGLGALTKATQLIAPLQIAVWMAVYCFARRTFPFKGLVGGGALFLVGLMTMLLPWTARNWIVFDAFVPVCTSGGLVLHSANNPETNGLYSELPDMADIASPADMLAHSRESSERAKTFIRDNPERFLNLAGNKFLHTWGVESTFTELINYRGRSVPSLQDGFSFVFFAGWAAVALLWCAASLRGIIRRARLSSIEILAGVVIISNALVYVVFEGGDRHHLPFVPFIVACSLLLLRETSSFGDDDEAAA